MNISSLVDKSKQLMDRIGNHPHAFKIGLALTTASLLTSNVLSNPMGLAGLVTLVAVATRQGDIPRATNYIDEQKLKPNKEVSQEKLTQFNLSSISNDLHNIDLSNLSSQKEMFETSKKLNTAAEQLRFVVANSHIEPAFSNSTVESLNSRIEDLVSRVVGFGELNGTLDHASKNNLAMTREKVTMLKLDLVENQSPSMSV